MKLLILDLDETLIYATEQALARPHDFVVGSYMVYKRPYVEEFIKFCVQHFKVAVWTSSTRSYAEEIVEALFPENYPLEFVFARDRCVRRFNPEYQDHYFIKDLRKVKSKGYTLEQIIMLDDTPSKLCRNYGNLVKIKEWLGEETDQELKQVQSYLLKLKAYPNIRCIEKRYWHNEI